MQTFLPYQDFAASAAVLDWQRLGKQRLECKQIILTLERTAVGIRAGYRNHPAVLMWKGYIGWLASYGRAMCTEWIRRGYEDNTTDFFVMRLEMGSSNQPIWLGDERLHSSHRARLLMKDPVWYGRFGWAEAPSEVNWWPVQIKQEPK